MGVLVWWLLLLLATVAAIVWLWWQGRTGAGEPGQMRSTKELERMRRAMEKLLAAKGRAEYWCAGLPGAGVVGRSLS